MPDETPQFSVEATTETGRILPVFWNWELVLTCNFRCTYCNYTALGWEGHDSLNVFPGMKHLVRVWDRIHSIYGPTHIELSGGEPSTYPGFFDLMAMLTEKHTITMDTNLSFNAERFGSAVNLRRIRLAASFHPEHASLEPFLEKCLLLRQKGIAEISVNYVAYPDHLKEMAVIRRKIKNAGISCFVQPFQGVYKKKTVYPAGYTQQETELIESAWNDNDPDTETSRQRFHWKGTALASGVDNQLRKISEENKEKRRPEQETPQKWRLPYPPKTTGSDTRTTPAGSRSRHCLMGHRYAKIYANGDTFRCCAQIREDMRCDTFETTAYLGNFFLDDDFKLLEVPAPCDYEPCPCDRCMVLGEESRWQKRWNVPGT